MEHTANFGDSNGDLGDSRRNATSYMNHFISFQCMILIFDPFDDLIIKELTFIVNPC